MSKYEISLLTEVFSFLFVTIDLYGKERLSRMNQKLLAITSFVNRKIETIQNFNFRSSREERMSKVVNGIIFYPAIITGVAASVTAAFDLAGDINVLNLIVVIILSLLAGALAWAMAVTIVVFGSAFVIVLAILILTEIARLLLRFVIWILGLINFEGLLLAAGSVLFLLSKYLEW